MPLPCIVNYSRQDEIAPISPTGRCCLLYCPAERRKLLFAQQPSQSETGAAPPMRNLHTLGSQYPPTDSLVCRALPNYPPPTFFPIKANSPSLFSGFAYDLPYLQVPNCNSSGYSQVNSLLLLK